MKYKNLVANPIITFCVVAHDNWTRDVELRGHATLEDDSDRSFLRFSFSDNRSGGEEPAADLDPPDAEGVTIRIHPEQVSSPELYAGRFGKWFRVPTSRFSLSR